MSNIIFDLYIGYKTDDVVRRVISSKCTFKDFADILVDARSFSNNVDARAQDFKPMFLEGIADGLKYYVVCEDDNGNIVTVPIYKYEDIYGATIMSMYGYITTMTSPKINLGYDAMAIYDLACKNNYSQEMFSYDNYIEVLKPKADVTKPVEGMFGNALSKMLGTFNKNANSGCFTITDISTGKVIFTDNANYIAKALSNGFNSIRNAITIEAFEQGVYDLFVNDVRFTFQDEVKDYELNNYMPYNFNETGVMRHPSFRIVRFSKIVELFFSRELELSDDILLLGDRDYVNEVLHKRGLQPIPYSPYVPKDSDEYIECFINKNSILFNMTKYGNIEELEIATIEELGETGMDEDVVTGGKCELKYKGETIMFNFSGVHDFEEAFYNGIAKLAIPYYKSLM